jgi:hypothetical protein
MVALSPRRLAEQPLRYDPSESQPGTSTMMLGRLRVAQDSESRTRVTHGKLGRCGPEIGWREISVTVLGEDLLETREIQVQ